MKKFLNKKIVTTLALLLIGIVVLAGCEYTDVNENSYGVINIQNEPEETADKEQNQEAETEETINLKFRNKQLLEEHFKKHGQEFPYDSPEDYLAGANKMLNNPNKLHKKEAEDGDDVYYLEETNEFIIVSGDGYIRTYFMPRRGIDYYNSQ